MSNTSEQFNLTGKKVAAGAGAALALFLGWKSYVVVQPNEFAVRTTMGAITSDDLPSGIQLKVPFAQSIYTYSRNVIINEFSAGSSGTSEANTQDRNKLQANIRLHYRIDPKAGDMNFHYYNLSATWGQGDGKSFLTTFINDSANAIFGRRPARETLGDDKRFLEEFYDNLNWRLTQNKIPVTVDMIELLNISATDYKIPVQKAFKPGAGIITQMDAAPKLQP